jgi:hypothetical protein
VGEVGEVMEDGAREGPGVAVGGLYDDEGICGPFLVQLGWCRGARLPRRIPPAGSSLGILA